MKTNQLHIGAGITRAIKCIAAAFMLAATTSAYAATIGQVGVPLGGNEFGVGKNLHLNSGTNLIYDAAFYTYELNATIVGKPHTPLGELYKDPIPLSNFLEFLKKGSSNQLKGTVTDTGVRPLTLVQKVFKGTKNLPGIGPVEISVKIKAEILESGQCVLHVTNVKMDATPAQDFGSLKILKGSKLIISSAPIITFLRTTISVDESKSFVEVPVWRLHNKHGICKVNFKTETGTATSSDFVSKTGTVTFPDGDSTEPIKINLVKPATGNGTRTFTIKLENPEDADLGETTEITVKIKDV